MPHESGDRTLSDGSDLIVVLIVVALLFGGSKLPKLARALGSASHEFKKGVEEGSKGDELDDDAEAGTAQNSSKS
jgi:sec-independent protein translocase protein TatA